VDDLWIAPDYTILAAKLGEEIKHSLPRLMKVLHDDSVSHDIIAIAEHSPVFDNQLWVKIKELVEDLLENVKPMALEMLKNMTVSDDSNDDPDE
jgi:hypothetical protein